MKRRNTARWKHKDEVQDSKGRQNEQTGQELPPTRKRREQRMKQIIKTYNETLQAYEKHHKAAYDAMRASTSVSTDAHIHRLLVTMGIRGHQFEDDVLSMVRNVWVMVVEQYVTETPPSEQRKEFLPILSVSGVLQQLRHELSAGLIQLIDRFKGAVITETMKDRTSPPCSFLPCVSDGKKVMNSLWYCERHWGLALFNGMRHDCDACHVWSVLGLKRETTGGHVWNTTHTSQVPLNDIGLQHGKLNVRVQRFCSPNVTAVGSVFIGPRTPRPSYRNHAGQNRLVPVNSFCYVNAYGRAEAWAKVQVKNLRDDSWRDVVTRDQFNEIMEQPGWSSHWSDVVFCPPSEENTVGSNGWGAVHSSNGGW